MIPLIQPGNNEFIQSYRFIEECFICFSFNYYKPGKVIMKVIKNILPETQYFTTSNKFVH